jgi:DNA-binding transcriptional LysR family regulator
MELRHLRYFIAVVEYGGFSHAARRLYVAQSAISDQIKDLEDEVGVALLNRNRRSVTPSPAGEIFLREAKKVLAAADHAIELAQRSERGEIGSLSIGFFTGSIGAFFPRLIREFRRRHPDVRVSLFEMMANENKEALIAGRIDLAFTRPLEQPFAEGFKFESLLNEEIVAVLPREHRLASSTIKLKALASEPFVLIDRDTWPPFFDLALSLCNKAGFAPRIVNTTGRWPGVLTLVEAGEGVSLVTEGVKRFRSNGLVFCNIVPTASIGLGVAWRSSHEGVIVRAFLNLLRESKGKITHT